MRPVTRAANQLLIGQSKHTWVSVIETKLRLWQFALSQFVDRNSAQNLTLELYKFINSGENSIVSVETTSHLVSSTDKRLRHDCSAVISPTNRRLSIFFFHCKCFQKHKTGNKVYFQVGVYSNGSSLRIVPVTIIKPP